MLRLRFFFTTSTNSAAAAADAAASNAQAHKLNQHNQQRTFRQQNIMLINSNVVLAEAKSVGTSVLH